MSTLTRRQLVAGLLVLSAATLLPTSASATPPGPNDPEFASYLLNRVDDLHRGRSSHGIMAMQVKTSRWERSMKMESWSLGEDYSLVRILEPKKERGTATLKAEDDLFTYLSKTGRTIKISGASMGGSWMGSHFTNDDLMKDSRMADAFDTEVVNGPTLNGQTTYALILTPKPKAVTVWGRIDLIVRTDNLLPVGQLFYDEDLDPVRKMEFFEFQHIDGYDIPRRLRMTPLDDDHAGEYTEITYESIDFGIELDPSFFSVAKLKSL